MGRKIDFGKAKELLAEEFAKAENDYLRATPPHVSQKAKEAAKALFNTSVQSYREALLGCAVAKVIDPDIDIRSPYAQQGNRAFSGRSLDEKVINPFLTDRQIPCSRGPYLASFRRSIRFVEETAAGLRDKEAYKSFLAYLEELEQADPDEARDLLRYLLYCFVELREQARVPLIKLQRISLDQYSKLINKLLSQPSGGLFPVLLVVALLKTVAEVYHLDWEVKWQGINVADRAQGAGGDVTVVEGDQVRIAFEVTERQIDRTRVEATFQSKISPLGIKDYLFVFTETEPIPEAQALAKQLFAQGHEVGFVQVRDWIFYNLATAGVQGRETFLKTLLELLEEAPATIKTIWNDQVRSLLEV